MKEHPDYKYRPRRKPKSGMANGKSKESARYSFSVDSVSHRHHQHQIAHHVPTHHHIQPNSATSLPNFNRTLFSSPDMITGSVSTAVSNSIPSSSTASGSTSAGMAEKSANERAELNYSRMLFASQLPSLHLGFATLGHPALHAATAVQIPWYHYSTMDSSVFNPLTHPASAGLHHRSVSHQHVHHQQHQQQLASLDSQLVAHQKMMRSIQESVSKKSPLPDDRVSPISNNNSSRPISAASSYDSECVAPLGSSATSAVPSTQSPLQSTPSAMILPQTSPSMAAVAAAAAAGLFPFHYGAAAAAAAAAYPHHHPTTTQTTHLGCNCSPLCVINHHQQHQQQGSQPPPQHDQRGLINVSSPLPAPRQHRCSLSTVL